MKLLILITGLFTWITVNAQVGIGTNTPSTNAALDVSSANKGILFPRLNDTTTVTNPTAGLMIYNKHEKSPAYHDGTKWNTMAARTAAAAALPDSITYTITGAANGFTNGVFGTISSLSTGLVNTYNFAGGGTGAGKPNFQDVAISKSLDSNSVAFIKWIAQGATNANMVIEFKMFTSGSATPKYSIKLKQPYITSYTVGAGSGGELNEQISMSGGTYGYKNWITNQSYAWDVFNNALAAY